MAAVANYLPKWPIGRQRMEKILHQLPGQHYIHEKGFCLSFLTDVPHGKIAAVGVLPEYRGKGLGTAFIKKAQAELRNIARSNVEGELKSLEIGSQTPRFWPQVPIDFSQEAKDFFLHRGTVNQYSTRSSDQKYVLMVSRLPQIHRTSSSRPL
jgi:beta-N-acetylhexosaminidase